MTAMKLQSYRTNQHVIVPNNKLERIYSRVQRILMSPVNDLTIAKATGVNHTTIMRMRRRSWDLGKSTFGTMLCLADFKLGRPLMHVSNHRIQRQYYIGLADINLNVDPMEYSAIIATVISDASSISELSRRIGVSRQKLESLKFRRSTTLNTKMSDLMKIVDYYYSHSHVTA